MMPLDIEKIQRHVKQNFKLREVLRDVLFFDQVSSTNRVALEMAASGLPGGLAILAESQNRGKGRLGRSWFSASGGSILLSLYLSPCIPLREYPLFSPAAAVGVLAGIEQATGLQAGIKWPNDIMIGEKKLGGILLETGAGGDQAPLVIGLGLNVNMEREDFPEDLRASATSLKAVLGKEIDRTALLIALLNGMAESIIALQSGSKTTVLAAVRAACLTIGKRIRVSTPQKIIEGWAEDIEEDGALRIRMGDQTHLKILMGDITHLRESKLLRKSF